ncbi:hypothetical protein PK35_08425 [Tamlana nanhaiensis]|uniref:Phage tail protein n=1 Tax=Neotamlana nanhaiensis TaxID=1382798 RepID=A0A0D7W1R7_9FLAO|nr:phage tail protein [Tamlana nanhaiensis]KJD32989.1 hypothetical protein PK35_08425 [Tamlana nanhaiensis]
MADEGQESVAVWLIPKFYFRVKFKTLNNVVAFQEVSGLYVESEQLLGNSNLVSSVKKLERIKTSSVILKKGVFIDDNNFWNWYRAVIMNTVNPETIVIELIDDSSAVSMTWTLIKAWPIKIIEADLIADAPNIAIELLELAYEGQIVNSGA